VRKHTVFEDSKLPLRKWYVAVWMLMDNPKGVAASRLASQIGVTHKTAWFMLHRLRETCQSANLKADAPDTSEPVEADETYVGGKYQRMHAWKRRELYSQGGAFTNKQAVLGFCSRADRRGYHSIIMGMSISKEQADRIRVNTDRLLHNLDLHIEKRRKIKAIRAEADRRISAIIAA